MAEDKKKHAEKTHQKESIKYFRRFLCPVLTKFPVCLVPVIKRQKGLNNTGNPEKCHKPANEHKHFPLTDFSPGKMAFSKYYAYYQEDNRLHQLEKLQP
jgi:hypothetical protein